MIVKVFFIVPFLLGSIFALAVGLKSAWSTDLWVLPLTIGIILGLSLSLAARRIKVDQLGPGDSGKDVSKWQKIFIELVLFAGLLAGIAMPLSAKRGILIGDHQVTTRSILTVIATLMGLSFIMKLLRYIRNIRRLSQTGEEGGRRPFD